MMIRFKKLGFLLLLVPFIINLNAQSLTQHSSTPYMAPGMNLGIDEFGKVGDYYYRYIKFQSLPKAALHQRMQDKGLILLEYIGKNIYIGAMHHSFTKENFQSYGIEWDKHIPSEDKIHDNLLERPLKAHAVKGNMVDMLIQYYKNVPAQLVEKELKSRQIKIRAHNKHNNFVSITVPIENINQISFINFVAFMDIAPEPGTPDDNNGRGMHRANVLTADYLGGRNYDGSGIKVQVRDDGVLGPHIDYHGRLLNDYTQFIGNDHSDGVAGIFTGAGNLNPRFRGMATGSDLYNTDYVSDFLDITLDLHLEENVLVTNSSYSDGCNNGYTNTTKIVDQQMFENPTYMHVFSAGNSNNNECGYGAGTQWGNITGGHKQGKNVIATANLNVDGNLVSSSSRGPAHDGRIKPDISAHGAGHISTGTGNTYDPFGGTSAAAPGIAGVFTMLHSAYQQLNDDETADAALIKASMLNSANDIGNQGPDFKYGWGLVNALRAARTLEENRYLNEEIEQGESNTHTIEIPDNVVQAKIMVYWADRDASTSANIALVNNLDATITNDTGAIFYPWILDPTPNPATLDLPATTGIDNLNNMEQVSLFNPVAGTYSFNITGTEIPFGPVKYFVVYDFIYDELEVIYPIGGEALVPGETENIHWDAPRNSTSDFNLSYSDDNGNTWSVIGSAPSIKRQLSWEVPATASGQCLVKIEQDSSVDQSDFQFSIAPVPQNITPIKVCPDSMTLTWDQMDIANGYEAFLLGTKFMDPAGTTSVNSITVAIDNPTEDNWYAVRALGSNNLVGLRSIAEVYNQNLLNCPLDTDAQMAQFVSNISNSILACDEYSNNLEIEIFNNGSQDITALDVYYQLDNNPVASGTTGPIAIGQNIQYSFEQEISIASSGSHQLKVWLTYPGDQYPANDTLIADFDIEILDVGNSVQSLNEDFQSGVFPPQDWTIQNPDNNITWEDWSTIGIDNTTTMCTRINNYSYNSDGEEDSFVSIPLFLNPDIANPELTFDMAYAYYSENYYDGLRIEITDCNGSFNDIVFYKEYMELATVGGVSGDYNPNSGSDWRTEIIDLTPYIGNDIIVRFVNVTGYGNNLYLDNIRLLPDSGPIAQFTTSQTSDICVGEPVTFTNTSSNFEELQWNFGIFSNPSTATGEGPHEVIFNLAGNQNVTLTASNSFGSNNYTETFSPNAAPVANFEFAIDGNTINFINTALNATSLSWNFGEIGAISNEPNPSHTYNEYGTYTIQLIASNQYCTPDTIEQTINIVSVKEANSTYLASIAPNPNNGDFTLSIKGSQSKELSISMIDLTGKEFYSRTLNPINGSLDQNIDVRNVASGIYMLKIQSDTGSKILKVIIE